MSNWVWPSKRKAGAYDYRVRFDHPIIGRKPIEVQRRVPAAHSGSKEEAEAYVDGKERELYVAACQDRKEEKKARVPTFDEYRPEYIAGWRTEGHKSGSEGAKVSYYKKWLQPVIGNVRMDEFTRRLGKQIKARCKKAGRKPRTINHAIDELHAMLNAAVGDQILTVDPVKLKRLKIDKEDVGFYSRDEFGMMLNASGDEQQLAILLGAHAGLRRGEICGLKWEDIDFKANTIRIRRALVVKVDLEYDENAPELDDDDDDDDEFEESSTKARKPRSVTMSRELAAALKGHRHLRGPRVFYEVDGGELRGDTVLGWLNDITAAAGLGKVYRPVHKLRHTFCSWLAIAGVDIKTIQKLAGHHSITVTEQYMWLAPNARQVAIASAFDGAEGQGDRQETQKAI